MARSNPLRKASFQASCKTLANGVPHNAALVRVVGGPRSLRRPWTLFRPY